MTRTEKRMHVRTSTSASFSFQSLIDPMDNRTFREGELVDYSLAGIRFITTARLQKNADLLIRLPLTSLGSDEGLWRRLWEQQEKETLDLIGSVMWCLQSAEQVGAYEVGARFIRKSF